MTDEELEADAARMLVPSLRSALKSMTQRQLENENIARAYDMGRDMERAAVVAWLRQRRYPDAFIHAPWVADAIERGEHRRKEEP